MDRHGPTNARKPTEASHDHVNTHLYTHIYAHAKEWQKLFPIHPPGTRHKKPKLFVKRSLGGTHEVLVPPVRRQNIKTSRHAEAQPHRNEGLFVLCDTRSVRGLGLESGIGREGEDCARKRHAWLPSPKERPGEGHECTAGVYISIYAKRVACGKQFNLAWNRKPNRKWVRFPASVFPADSVKAINNGMRQFGVRLNGCSGRQRLTGRR